MAVNRDAFEQAVRKYDEAKNEILKFATPRPQSMEALGCSFCCRPKSEVRASVAGPDVFICDECVVMCHKLLREQGAIES